MSEQSCPDASVNVQSSDSLLLNDQTVFKSSVKMTWINQLGNLVTITEAAQWNKIMMKSKKINSNLNGTMHLHRQSWLREIALNFANVNVSDDGCSGIMSRFQQI